MPPKKNVAASVDGNKAGTGEKKFSWTPELDVKLLMLITVTRTVPTAEWEILADKLGAPTPFAIKNRIQKLKKDYRTVYEEVGLPMPGAGTATDGSGTTTKGTAKGKKGAAKPKEADDNDDGQDAAAGDNSDKENVDEKPVAKAVTKGRKRAPKAESNDGNNANGPDAASGDDTGKEDENSENNGKLIAKAAAKGRKRGPKAKASENNNNNNEDVEAGKEKEKEKKTAGKAVGKGKKRSAEAIENDDGGDNDEQNATKKVKTGADEN